ncbi:autophagy-related protein 18h isoform X2 [Malania oleifera]|uniref:autophagy-related protein 18h isoform X2 n=2 Tax=Malania oleifera TaxID=397392 RepID=UPI0025AE8869|nr:autophagy-related protein 18h isoform X2 [Malania oleifera]
MKNHKTKTNGFIPNSFKFISSCIKTVSTNVRSASASVAGSISGDSEHRKDQVLWACFDRLELGPSSFKHVLLLGYSNGFQVLDVEDASNVSELVSRRDDPVTFLQIQPTPAKSEGCEGFRASHPLLLVVAVDDTNDSGQMHGGRDGLVRDGYIEPKTGNFLNSPTAVRFYSLRSHSYVHVLRFRSTVYMVRCSPQVVAVGLAAQIYCFDALTLENKFSVLTYPVPQLGGQGSAGVNIGYGPMAVGSRWLAYASNNPLFSNTGRLSPQSLTPSPGVSPSTSPSSGNLVARYAMESSKQLAAGLINLGDMGYKTLSKYYQDLLPDGSNSPVSSNSSWKVGRVTAHSTETETAGMVVIKDLVSRAVISQFRAHTSPISGLCFDPSGTLLVTASIHGNNINIFRIMPSCSKNGSGTLIYDWSSSHVHLYKLHRGMTPAVIQDICFSNYSQWVAIVSSRGTCHIFVLSPFGGEAGLQIQSSHVDGPKLLPALSLPWWHTPSFLINQQSFAPPPPAPITLSVVSRIKNISGWLHTVSNAASSAAGKVYVPSGAVTAVFHCSVPSDLQPAQLKSNVLEHLLVYTPSGHVIQHKLLPSMWGEPGETASRTGPAPLPQMQDEELHVKVEPVQWWDVCRGTDWPEKEECIAGITLGRQAAEIDMDTSDCEDNDGGDKDFVKPHERHHIYLSNAEVQISSGRIPIWQKSKIHFYTMSPHGANELNFTEDHNGGEIEIEKVPVHEVEIRRKDLLPVFDHFRRIHSNWIERGFVGATYPSCEQESAKDKSSKDAVISDSKLEPSGSVENSDSSSSKTTEDLLDLGQMNSHPSIVHIVNENDGEKRGSVILAAPLLNQSSPSRNIVSVSPERSIIGVSPVEDSCSANSQCILKSGSLSSTRTIAKESQPSNSAGASDVSNTSSSRSDLTMNILEEGPVHDALDFEPFFQEGYYKASPLNGSHELTEVATDVDSSSSPCDRGKSEEDGDNDDVLGGVFAFCEEGKQLIKHILFGFCKFNFDFSMHY